MKPTRKLRTGVISSAASLTLLATAAVPMAYAAPGESTAASGDDGPVKLIYDTDFGGDVDDAGVAGLLNALQDNGEVDVLAMMASNPGTQWSAGGLDAINTYYRNGNIPLGVRDRGSSGEQMDNVSGYAEHLARFFPNNTGDGARVPDATDLYRQTLSAQPDHSVTIVVVGSQSNLANLLASGPDKHIPLTGTELVDQKVKQLVIMGSTCTVDLGFAEWNIRLDPQAAIKVSEEWPTRVVYSGFEVGDTIFTGSRLFYETPEENPVQKAYELYVGFGNDRNSWDQTAAYYAVRGGDGLFGLSEPGVNNIEPDGTNTFTPDPAGNHYCMTTLVPDEQIATALEDLMVQLPKKGPYREN